MDKRRCKEESEMGNDAIKEQTKRLGLWLGLCLFGLSVGMLVVEIIVACTHL